MESGTNNSLSIIIWLLAILFLYISPIKICILRLFVITL